MQDKSKSSMVLLINGVFIEILMLVLGEKSSRIGHKKLINGSGKTYFGG